MRRHLLVFGTILLSLFLFSYSCQDHQLPGVPPSLVTLETSPSGLKCQARFNLNVVDIGNIPVTEYGVVVAGTNIGGSPSDTPTIENHTKVIFDTPFSNGLKAKTSTICSNNMTFRAYAILNNGTVIYGNILSFMDV